MRARWTVTLVAVAAMVASSLAPVAAHGVAATTETPYLSNTVESPDPEFSGRWAERLATAGDLDNDGINDVFVGVPREDVGAMADVGRVYALSGATMETIYVIDAPEPQTAAQFAFFISVPGDVDGDGVPDIAVGTDAQDVTAGGTSCQPEDEGCNVDQGKAWVFSGMDGSMLYALDNPNPQGTADNSARFGSRIGRAGDVTGDGVSEVLVGASNNDIPAGCGDSDPVPADCQKNIGQAFVFNGATGALVRTYDLPAEDRVEAPCESACGSFGLAVQGPGDTDGDDVVDHYINGASVNGGAGRSYVFSGATGELLLSVDSPEPQEGFVFFGFQDAAPLSPGDVNGDGHADLYANGFLQDAQGLDTAGKAWLFDGNTGEFLYALNDPTPETGGQFGWSMAATDYNGDDIPDMYVGQSPHHTVDASGQGGTYVFDGTDGGLLKTLEFPESALPQPNTSDNLGPALGWGLAAPGDLNRDGLPDYLGGAPFADVGDNQDQGLLVRFFAAGTIRYEGTDRIETAIAVSQAAFSEGSADGVVLARADLFPDALSGIPLAADRNAPLLLTPTGEVDTRTENEIQRILPTGGTVYVLGGEAALSETVSDRLASLGYEVVRYAGADRFATAVAIADQGLENPSTFLLATGLEFPDGLSAGAAAHEIGAAVLLTAGDEMASPTSDYLAGRSGAELFAIGGPAARAAPSAEEVSGSDRFATSVAVAERFFDVPTVVGVASGVAFPDAMTGGVHVAILGGPMLLSEPERLSLVVDTYLEDNAASIQRALLYGGLSALSDEVEDEVSESAG